MNETMVRARLALQSALGSRVGLTAVVLLVVVLVAAVVGWLDPITSWVTETFGVDND